MDRSHRNKTVTGVMTMTVQTYLRRVPRTVVPRQTSQMSKLITAFRGCLQDMTTIPYESSESMHSITDTDTHLAAVIQDVKSGKIDVSEMSELSALLNNLLRDKTSDSMTDDDLPYVADATPHALPSQNVKQASKPQGQAKISVDLYPPKPTNDDLQGKYINVSVYLPDFPSSVTNGIVTRSIPLQQVREGQRGRIRHAPHNLETRGLRSSTHQISSICAFQRHQSRQQSGSNVTTSPTQLRRKLPGHIPNSNDRHTPILSLLVTSENSCWIQIEWSYRFASSYPMI